jgi:hypothetical protein
MTPSEPSYPMTTSPGYPNTPEAQESDLEFNLKRTIVAFKEKTIKSLNEIQENTIK